MATIFRYSLFYEVDCHLGMHLRFRDLRRSHVAPCCYIDSVGLQGFLSKWHAARWRLDLVLEQTLTLTLPVALLLIRALVVFLFALGEPNLKLG